MATKISLQHPTPQWARVLVRAVLYVTGIWAFMLTFGLDLQDFGVPEKLNFTILKYMTIMSASASGIARFLGVEPVKFDTDKPL